MPCLHRQFSVLAVGHRLPARSQSFPQIGLHQVFVDRFRRNTVNARTECFIGHEAARGVPRCDTWIVWAAPAIDRRKHSTSNTTTAAVLFKHHSPSV